jgi:Ras-related protein Rab-7A
MGSSFYRNSEACILVFDLTSLDSFKNVESWRNEFLKSLNPPDSATYPFILLGNKSDMSSDIKVSNEAIDNYCKEHNNMPYFATSAKEDINLEEAFNKVADMAFIRNTKNEESFVPTDTKFLKVTQNEPKEKKCCGK